ncbi:hypothetical protein QTI66_02630 [Variovorax sp. J22R133]|uniref:hypothetical protein n=1 Tax=Variovorax brevis TaxID=3053503 RepID=UPI0025778502|nr:hypothetical protein [Variovorax sp. J22R133]MDM0111023.1 hypothetical protein [Variovorax sp. J22R133]
MTALPTPADVALLSDDELLQLAHQWRTRASHGMREAFGVAHSLEVECRRRLRGPSARPHVAESVSSQYQRPWWKIWNPARSGGATAYHG